MELEWGFIRKRSKKKTETNMISIEKEIGMQYISLREFMIGGGHLKDNEMLFNEDGEFYGYLLGYDQITFKFRCAKFGDLSTGSLSVNDGQHVFVQKFPHN